MNEKKLDFFSNCFDPIRLWAAFSVMFLHYTGYAINLSDSSLQFMHVLRTIVSLFPGVVVLFALSGFLISASCERSKDFKDYFRKRVLRMYPELWVCTIVNLIVVSILAYKMLDKSIFLWLATQFLGIANTPSCLKTFATGSINGSLWTIFTEIQLYVILGLSFKYLIKLNTIKWLFLLIFLVMCNIGADYFTAMVGGGLAKLIERSFFPYAIWFFIGVFCYVKWEQFIPKLKKIFPILFALYLFFYLLPIEIPGYYADIVVSILLPLIVIGGVSFTKGQNILRFEL